MAEILLSLTIIGVVATITLPSLTGNINERTWNTQRKALYARFSQALALMPNLNGYGTYTLAVEADDENGVSAKDAVDTAAETFVTEGLAKVLKINNICDSEHLTDCGIASSFQNLAGSVISPFPTKLSELNEMFTSIYNDGPNGSGGNNFQNPQKDIDTKAAAFETANGESVALFYNPNCICDLQKKGLYYSQPYMCANFIYDLNGTKGPNTVGKDIGFITALYPSDPVIVAPMPLPKIAGASKQTGAGKLCQKQDPESRVPNRDELTALFYNRKLIGIETGYFWSSSVFSPGEDGRAWRQHFNAGHIGAEPKSSVINVWCVKR